MCSLVRLKRLIPQLTKKKKILLRRSNKSRIASKNLWSKKNKEQAHSYTVNVVFFPTHYYYFSYYIQR